MDDLIDAEPPKPKRRYKARAKKLVLSGELLRQLTVLAQLQCTQKEAAEVLAVSPRLLAQFLAEHPEAREAWNRGRGIGHVSLRRLLWKQAQVDPTQARFLGKHWLDMGGKPRQRTDDEDKPVVSDEERIARILELQAKVLAKAGDPTGGTS